jgi:hypothetical protein
MVQAQARGCAPSFRSILATKEEAMNRGDMMPIDIEEMFSLSDDRRSVRLTVPPFKLEGIAAPVRVNLNFEAHIVDEILERLGVLRAQMAPLSSLLSVPSLFS